MTTKPLVETFQTPFELDQMLAIFNRLQPTRVLEIGSWQGGTLWHWLQPGGVTVVSVDDQMRLAGLWAEWADEAGSDLHLLRGFSQDTEIIEAARDLAPFQFVLIDGDHTYDAVKADWDNYSPLVEAGGVVLFHDILHRPNYGVDQVWSEVKGAMGARWLEIVETSDPDDPRWGGLGAIWL